MVSIATIQLLVRAILPIGKIIPVRDRRTGYWVGTPSFVDFKNMHVAQSVPIKGNQSTSREGYPTQPLHRDDSHDFKHTKSWVVLSLGMLRHLNKDLAATTASQ